jgi:hypothetical protein
MKYMHSIIKGQRKSVITEVEKRLKIAGLGGQVKVQPDSVLKKEFYIEVDSEELITDIRQILKTLCKEKEVTMQGGLIEDDTAKSRQRLSKPLNVAPAAVKAVTEKPPSRDYPIGEKVVALLSNHRSTINAAIPLPLTKKQLLSLLTSSVSPIYPSDKLSQELEVALKELEAKGEIYANEGDRFCIAQPSVLYANALFRGDRAYLHLAHQVVGNPVTDSTKLTFPAIDFDVLKERFLEKGISCLQR